MSRARVCPGLPGCLSFSMPRGEFSFTLEGSFPLHQHQVSLSGYCRKNFPPIDEQPVNNHHDHSQHFPLLPNLPCFYPAVYGLLKISSLPVFLQGATWSCSEHHLPRGLKFSLRVSWTEVPCSFCQRFSQPRLPLLPPGGGNNSAPFQP